MSTLPVIPTKQLLTALLECIPTSPDAPSDKSNNFTRTKISLENWQNDTDRGKRKYSEKNLLHRYSVHQKSHMTNPGLKTDLQGEIPAPNCLSQESTVDRLVFTTCMVRSGPLDIIGANFHRVFSEYFLFSLSASFYDCSILTFIYTLFLSQGQTNEVWNLPQSNDISEIG
jgi:hypothetical protein